MYARHLFVGLVLSACGEVPSAPPPADAPAPAAVEAAAPAGDVYGEPLTLTERTPISTLLTDIDRFDGQKVQVEGMVSAVCEKRGCWMAIAGDQPFQELRFKVEDGVITIPVEAKGRYAVAEGVARKIVLSPEDAQEMRAHEAEEQGTPIDTTPLPTYLVRLEGTGAVIRDRM